MVRLLDSNMRDYKFSCFHADARKVTDRQIDRQTDRKTSITSPRIMRRPVMEKAVRRLEADMGTEHRKAFEKIIQTKFYYMLMKTSKHLEVFVQLHPSITAQCG